MFPLYVPGNEGRPRNLLARWHSDEASSAENQYTHGKESCSVTVWRNIVVDHESENFALAARTVDCNASSGFLRTQ
jgi:hypothetical protein